MLIFFSIAEAKVIKLTIYYGLISENDNSDERNLLYVAVTRAKTALQVTRTITNVLKQSGVGELRCT